MDATSEGREAMSNAIAMSSQQLLQARERESPCMRCMGLQKNEWASKHAFRETVHAKLQTPVVADVVAYTRMNCHEAVCICIWATGTWLAVGKPADGGTVVVWMDALWTSL